MNKQMKFNYIKNIGLLIYFLVLGIERSLAVIFGFINHNFTNGAFNTYTHVITLLSLVAAFIILNKQFIYMIKAIITRKENDLNKLNYKIITIAAGVILIGGMVHTSWTQLIVQFVSYAGMIVSMLMIVIENFNIKENRLKLINNYIYIVSFAMAIPVAYAINKNNAYFLEPFQCVASITLVGIYTYFMYIFYNNKGETKFMIPTLFILLAFDLPIFILRFSETINVFLVIFPIICLINVIIDLLNKRLIHKWFLLSLI